MKRNLLLSLVLLIAVVPTAAAENARETVTVTGAVSKPGAFPYRAGMTLSELLKQAGGPAMDASLRVRLSSAVLSGPVRHLDADKVRTVARGGGFGSPSAMKNEYELQGPKDFLLYAGDEIHVFKRQIQPGTVVTRYFRDVPFAEAVGSILKDTGYGYTIDPSVAAQHLTVTASLKNAPVDVALSRIAQAAGTRITIGDGVVSIGPSTSLYGVQHNLALGTDYRPYSPSAGTNATLTRGTPAATPVVGYKGAIPAKSETIELNYVQAGDVLPLVSNVAGVQAARAEGQSRLIITAPEGSLDEARKAIATLDTQDALPRAVQIGLAATVTVEGRDYSCTTSARGAEGTQVPLNLSASDIDLGRGLTGQIELEAMATPTVLRSPIDGSDVSLSGSGVISGSLPAKFRQRFNFSVSLASGLVNAGDSVKGTRFKDEPVIASGSLKAGATNIDFRVTANALVDAGRIVSQARAYNQNPFGALDSRAAEEYTRKQFADQAQARSLSKLGSGMLAQGKLDDARKCFQEAILLDLRNPQAHNGLGKVLLSQGKIDEAIDELSKAVALDPQGNSFQADLDKAIKLRGAPAEPRP